MNDNEKIIDLCSKLSTVILQKQSWPVIKDQIDQLITIHKTVSAKNQRYIEEVFAQAPSALRVLSMDDIFQKYCDYMLSLTLSDDFYKLFLNKLAFSKPVGYIDTIELKQLIENADKLSPKALKHTKFLIHFSRGDVFTELSNQKNLFIKKNKATAALEKTFHDEYTIRNSVSFENDEFGLGNAFQQGNKFMYDYNMSKRLETENDDDIDPLKPFKDVAKNYETYSEEKKVRFWHKYISQTKEMIKQTGVTNGYEILLSVFETEFDQKISFIKELISYIEENEAQLSHNAFSDILFLLQEQIISNPHQTDYTQQLMSIYEAQLKKLTFFETLLIKNINFNSHQAFRSDTLRNEFYSDYNELYMDDDSFGKEDSFLKKIDSLFLDLKKESHSNYIKVLDQILTVNKNDKKELRSELLLVLGKIKNIDANKLVQAFDKIDTLHEENTFEYVKRKIYIEKFKHLADHFFAQKINTVTVDSPVNEIILALAHPHLLQDKNLNVPQEKLLESCGEKFRQLNQFYDPDLAEKLLTIVKTEKKQNIKDLAATYLFRLVHYNADQHKFSDTFKDQVYEAFKKEGYNTLFYNLKTEDQIENGCWYWAPRNLVKNLHPNQSYPSFYLNNEEIKNNWIKVKADYIDIPNMVLHGSTAYIDHILQTSNGFKTTEIFDKSQNEVKTTYSYSQDYKSRVMHYVCDKKVMFEEQSSSKNNVKQKIVDILDKQGPFVFGGEFSRWGAGGHAIICTGYALNGNILFFADSAPAGYTSFMSYDQFKKRAQRSYSKPFAMMGYHYKDTAAIRKLPVFTDIKKIASKRPNSKELIPYDYQ